MPRAPHHSFAAVSAFALGLLALPSLAHAERASRFVLGPELRVRPRDSRDGRPSGTSYELALPNGLVSASGVTAVLFRAGLVIPGDGLPLALPASAGFRFSPLPTRLRPVFGTDIGGYFTLASGPPDEGTPEGSQWCWSARALAGVAVALHPAVSLLTYVDAMWVQTPHNLPARAQIFTTYGAGIELRFAFAPTFHLLDMVVSGTSAPEGF